MRLFCDFVDFFFFVSSICILSFFFCLPIIFSFLHPWPPITFPSLLSLLLLPPLIFSLFPLFTSYCSGLCFPLLLLCLSLSLSLSFPLLPPPLHVLCDHLFFHFCSNRPLHLPVALSIFSETSDKRRVCIYSVDFFSYLPRSLISCTVRFSFAFF